jgi:hypothetical protein
MYIHTYIQGEDAQGTNHNSLIDIDSTNHSIGQTEEHGSLAMREVKRELAVSVCVCVCMCMYVCICMHVCDEGSGGRAGG